MNVTSARPLVAAAFFVLPAAALAAPVTIADLAPRNAIAVVGVDDWPRMMTALNATSLDDLMAEPSVKAWLKSLREDDESPVKGLQERLERVDSSLEEIGWPTGMAGGAIWAAQDADTGKHVPRWVIAADYGARAGDIEKTLVALLEDSEDRDEITLDEDTVGDAKVWSITVNARAEEEDDEMGGGALLDAALEPTKLHLARAGSVFVLAGDMSAVERAVDRLGGDDIDSVADAPAFSTAMSQAGDAHAYGALLVGNLFDWLLQVQRAADDAGEFGPFDAMPMAPQALWSSLGLDAVTSVSAGVRFDAEGTIMEVAGGVAASEKRGLLSLFNLQGGAFTPPAFVGADVHALTTVKIDFSRILPLIQQIVSTLPPEEQQEAGGMVALVSAQAAPLLAALGNDVVIAKRLERPFSPQSDRTLIGVSVKDGGMIAAAFGQFGLPARDFEGFQIWEPPMGGDSCVGLGGGHLFVGERSAVEGALRSVGRPDAPKLADEAAFQRAGSLLRGGGMLYSFQELRPSLEFADWMRQNIDAVVRANLEPMLEGVDPEEAREWMDEAIQHARENMGWMKDFPRAEVILRHIGDSAADIRATDDGFRFRNLLLPAR